METGDPMDDKQPREHYVKPVLMKHGSLLRITFECPDWQCSVTVPGEPV